LDIALCGQTSNRQAESGPIFCTTIADKGVKLMAFRNRARPGPFAILLGGVLLALASASAQEPQQTAPIKTAARPILAPQAQEHPLMPALRWAKTGLKDVEKIADYSAILVKRERIDGELRDPEYAYAKVRHRPLSVYMRFLKPENLAGREVIWMEGVNNGKMWAHGTGVEKMFGTVHLDPNGAIAMRGNRYPITEMGLLNLVNRLIEVGEKDAQYGECEVKFFEGARINGRSCTCIQVTHPKPRREFLFHIARIYVDEELNIPIRYEAWDWPDQPGGQPELTEEYTYLEIKLNNGFTDADFDINNPSYEFKRG
jgi:hypothetical protein